MKNSLKKEKDFDKELNMKWKKIGQECFEKKYPDLDFMSIFGKNYK